MVIARTVKRERENRHIINGTQLDERLRRAVRDVVEVRLQLLIQAHQALVCIGADDEPHEHEALAGARGGINILHAGDFPEQFFHGPGDAFLGFLGARAGHRNEHVHHRDFDLRLLFTRQQEHGGHAQQDGGDNDERRQLGVDERLGDPPRQPERF